MPSASRPRRPKGLPLLLFAVTFTVFLCLLPERLYGDDVWFVHCIVHGYPFATHFLYIPLATAVTWIGALLDADPFLVLRILAAGGTAAGGALLLAAALRRGFGIPGALGLSLLILSASSTLFFATAGEIHGIHLAAVGFLVWVLAGLRAESPSRRVLAVGLSFGLVLGTHKSGVLLLPGVLAAYGLATRGRTARERRRDLVAVASAAFVVLGAKILFTWIQIGRPFGSDDALSWYWKGLRGRIANGYGWRRFALFLSEDGVVAAFPLAVAGSAALGRLGRVRPALFAAALLVLVPYAVFFALFDYPERGAYFIVVLPILAAALVHLFQELPSGPRPASFAALLPIAVALAGAPLRPGEITGVLGRWAPLALVGLAFLWGVLLPRAPVAGRALLLALIALQATGSVRELRAYDRETPVLDWARGVCGETAGREAVVIVAGFQELWILDLLRQAWREPWAGTWALAREVARPAPAGLSYGDPNISPAEFARLLGEKLERGVLVYVDESVRRFLRKKPRHAALLERVEREYRLERVDHGAFHAERILPETAGG